MKRFLLAGLILFVFVSCTQEEDYEFEPEPNILGLMRIGDTVSSQLIIVDQSYDITDTVNEYGVNGATVRIIGEQDTFNFPDTFWDPWTESWVHSIDGWYWGWIDFSDSTSYSLEVVLPWDDTVTADAMMPTPIRISSPADSDTVSISAQPHDPHVVTWNFCKNTELYLVYCIPDVDTSELGNISPIFSMPSFTMDTSYTFFLERMIAPWIYDKYYVLRVIAVSPEYVDYMGAEVPGGSVSNLSSGYGMFGGIAEDAVRVFIVP